VKASAFYIFKYAPFIFRAAGFFNSTAGGWEMYWHVPQMTLYTTTTTILHAIVMEKVIVDVMMMVVVVRWAPRACAPLCLCVCMCVHSWPLLLPTQMTVDWPGKSQSLSGKRWCIGILFSLSLSLPPFEDYTLFVVEEKNLIYPLQRVTHLI
jgi:hypothetical protein